MFLLELGLIGLCVALLPLSYLWVKADQHKFRKLVWTTTFLTLDLVMFGSFTRLTDSGLGCPDWPGCYRTASPLLAHAQISAAHQAMPTGPVSFTKAWIEMVHRYFAMAVGILVITQVVIAWRRRRTLTVSPWWPTALLALVCLQGAFGMWTVTQKLQPLMVTAHLLLALLLLGALGLLGARQTPMPPVEPGARHFRLAAAVGLALVVVQIALGGWVSANYAVLACTDFPTCNGQWIPTMDFGQGFHLWRALGRTGGGDFISQPALVAIHWTHRTFAAVVIAYWVWLALKLRGYASLRQPALAVIGVLEVQVVTGLSNIVLDWPLPVAVAHNGGAAVLLLLLVMLNCRLARSRYGPAASSSPDASGHAVTA